MTGTTLRRLSRERDGRPAAPVRIAHLGPGNFFRAHQAWYTEHAPDAADWGIAAFAGRRGAVARELAAQDGLYTLLVRAADGDRPEVVSARRRGVGRARRLAALLRPPGAGAGHHHRHRGRLPARRGRRPGPGRPRGRRGHRRAPRATAPTPTWSPLPASSPSGSRCAARTACPGVAVVPCDNVPDNGAMVARVVGELAAAVDPGLAAWIAEHVTFVTTMVDRITPHTTDDDRAEVRDRDRRGRPGPGGHRALRRVGAGRRVPAGPPALGGRRGPVRRRHRAVGARASCGCSTGRTRSWPTPGRCAATRPSRRRSRTRSCAAGWSSGGTTPRRHLPLPAEEIAAYRAALLERYANPRIRHLLAQIAADGSQKVPIRILPTVRADLAGGRVPTGAARVLAAWVCHLRGRGAPVADVAAEEFTALAAGRARRRRRPRAGPPRRRRRAAERRPSRRWPASSASPCGECRGNCWQQIARCAAPRPCTWTDRPIVRNLSARRERDDRSDCAATGGGAPPLEIHRLHRLRPRRLRLQPGIHARLDIPALLLHRRRRPHRRRRSGRCSSSCGSGTPSPT